MEEYISTPTKITRHTIISNIATLFTGSAIAQGLTAITFILTARILGPEQYGQYTASMTLAIFCSIVFSLGLNLWLLQEGGRRSSQIGNLIGSVLFIKILLGLVYLMLMIVLASLINNSSLPANLVRLSALIVWLHNLFVTSLTAFKAVLRNKTTAVLETVLATVILFFTLILIASNVGKAANYMQMRAIILFFSFLVALLLVKVLLQSNSSWITAKFVLSKTPPYAASEFLAWMYMRVDVLIIAIMLDEYAVGLYAPAAGIIIALYLLPSAINFVFIPVLSKLFATNIRQGWLTAKRLIILLVIVGFSLFIAVLFGAKYFVLLLGSSFAGSQVVLQILSIILFIHSISFGLAAILVANNQQTQRSIIQAITVAINIGLNLIVVRRVGIYGVAYVYVITEVILLVGYLFLVLRFRHKTSTNLSSIRSEIR